MEKVAKEEQQSTQGVGLFVALTVAFVITLALGLLIAAKVI